MKRKINIKLDAPIHKLVVEKAAELNVTESELIRMYIHWLAWITPYKEGEFAKRLDFSRWATVYMKKFNKLPEENAKNSAYTRIWKLFEKAN